MKNQDLREQVAQVARRMIESGLATGTSGNVSARTPEGDVLITPSGLDYAQLEPEDIVLVDLDKNLLEGSLEPSTETPMHTGIYKVRLNAEAVVHTHSRYATTLACLGWEIPPVHYMLTTLSGDGRIPLAPYTIYGTEELAGYAAEALGESRNACLLQNHGTTTAPGSPENRYSSPPSRSKTWRPRYPATASPSRRPPTWNKTLGTAVDLTARGARLGAATGKRHKCSLDGHSCPHYARHRKGKIESRQSGRWASRLMVEPW